MSGKYSIQKIDGVNEKLMYEGKSKSEGHLFLHSLLQMGSTVFRYNRPASPDTFYISATPS